MPSARNSQSNLDEMVKDGELKAPATRCDLCGSPSTVILTGGKARCAAHVLNKEASSEEPLKGVGERLSDNHSV